MIGEWLYGLYGKGLTTQPWGAPVKIVDDVIVPVLTACGPCLRKLGLQQMKSTEKLKLQSISVIWWSWVVLNAGLKVMERIGTIVPGDSRC